VIFSGIPPHPLPLGVRPRLSTKPGLHSYVDRTTGEIVYYAVTTTGALLYEDVRRRLPDEWPSQIKATLWCDLVRQDPEIIGYLRPSLGEQAYPPAVIQDAPDERESTRLPARPA
jgi:hypothetical protein